MNFGKILKGINVKFSVNISDESKKELSDAVLNIKRIFGVQDTTPTKEAVNEVLENSNVKKVKNALDTPAEEQEPKQEQDNNKLSISAICGCIRSHIALIKDAANREEIKSVSKLLNQEVLKLTSGRINVYLSAIGGRHKILPNFRQTPEIASLFNHKRWHGWVSIDELKNVLTKAFVQNNNNNENKPTVKDSRRKNSHPRARGYHQKHYKRVVPGSMMVRMRRHSNNKELAPMIIDASLAAKLFNQGLTKVNLVTHSKTNMEIVFSKREKDAPQKYKLKREGRLVPFGRTKSTNEISTYCINGVEFQKSILGFLKETCPEDGERFFKLAETDNKNKNKIAYRIEKV